MDRETTKTDVDGPTELGRVCNRHDRRAQAAATREAMPQAFRNEVSSKQTGKYLDGKAAAKDRVAK